MPASMNFNRYASAWLELFDYLCENPTLAHEVPCVSVEQAKSMRLEFYKARKAIGLSEAEFKEKDPVGYNQMGHGALDGREVRVRDHIVVFDCKDTNDIAKLILSSLDKVKGE